MRSACEDEAGDALPQHAGSKSMRRRSKEKRHVEEETPRHDFKKAEGAAPEPPVLSSVDPGVTVRIQAASPESSPTNRRVRGGTNSQDAEEVCPWHPLPPCCLNTRECIAPPPPLRPMVSHRLA